MIKIIIMLSFLLLAFQNLAQSISQLEHEVEQIGLSDTREIRKKAEEIFNIDPFNEIATSMLVATLRYKNRENKITKYFTELKAKFPNNPSPYILSSYIQYPKFSLQDTSGLKELKLALELDLDNVQANQLAGRMYYALFHEAINENHVHTRNFAKYSRRYFEKTIELDSSLWGYGIVVNQLNYYLRDHSLDSSFVSYEDINHPYINILKPIYYYKYGLNGTSRLLEQIEEPALKGINKGTSFRLRWIRTFHNPIIIRLNSDDEKITITWKRTNGLGGYYIGEMVENRSKQISKHDFDKILKSIDKLDFWESPESLDIEYAIMDGSFFTLEGVINDNYHSIYRRSLNELGGLVQLFLSLTELSIPEEEIY